MSSIIFSDLKQVDKVSTDYTFVDLHLDIEEARVRQDGLENLAISNDIKVDWDERAIKNSLINIFNTIPGERFLIPRFGCNLYAYLFTQVTDFTAKIIGKTILNAIELWEPRVIVDKVEVIAKPDDHEYNITVKVIIMKLKYQTQLTGVLTQGGFREV